MNSWQWLLVAAGVTTTIYLAFISWLPVAGKLDDAIIVACVLRTALRASGPLREHWPDPTASPNALMRLAHGPAIAVRHG